MPVHVRVLDDEVAAGRHGPAVPQEHCRAAEVLKYVREQDRVETLAAELRFEVELFGVANEDTVAVGQRQPPSLGVSTPAMLAPSGSQRRRSRSRTPAPVSRRDQPEEVVR
jgi:hypothetical protein